MVDLSFLKSKYEEAQEEKSKIWGLYQTAMTLCFVNQDDRLDNTGVNAKNKLTNKMINWGTPPGIMWGVLKTSLEETTAGDREILMHFSEIRHTYHMKSNFDDANLHGMQLFCSVGTKAIQRTWTGNPKKPFKYRSANLENLWISNDAFGRVSYIFYKHTLKIDKYKEMFPNFSVPPKNQNTPFEVLEVTALNPETGGFEYLVFEGDGIAESKILGKEELSWNNWVIGRWGMFEHGGPWGAGPAVQAMQALEQTADKRDDLSKAGKVQIMPPQLAYGPGYERMELLRTAQAGEVLYMGESKNALTVEPFQATNGIDITAYNVEDFKSAVREAFYLDILDMIDGMEKAKDITATAMQIMTRQFAQAIQPVFARYAKSYLAEVVKGEFQLLEALKIGGIDLQALELDHEMIDVRFENTLTLSQEQEKLNNTVSAIAETAELPGGAQYIQASFKVDKFFRKLLEAKGADLDLFKGESETIDTMESQQNMMAEAMQAGQVQGGE